MQPFVKTNCVKIIKTSRKKAKKVKRGQKNGVFAQNTGMSFDFKDLAIYSAGVFAGIVNGLLGGGGGMIVVPALSIIASFESKKAHATTLAVILPASVVSALIFLLSGKSDKIALLVMTLGMTAGGVLGSFLLKKLKSPVVSKIFAFVMLAAGVKMLFF